MEILMLAAAVMAFAPTLILMYAILRKYTYPAVEQPFFSDPTFFILFTIALVAGTILFAVYTWVWVSILYAILFAVVEILVIVVVFNLKRFRGKVGYRVYGSDTTRRGMVRSHRSSIDLPVRFWYELRPSLS